MSITQTTGEIKPGTRYYSFPTCPLPVAEVSYFETVVMNILIISTNRNALPMPVMPIGACMVAEACERAGHRVAMLDLMFERQPREAVGNAIRSSRPDVVGIRE